MTILHDGDQLWVGETRLLWREHDEPITVESRPRSNTKTLLYALTLVIALLFGLWGAWTVFSDYFGTDDTTHITYSLPNDGGQAQTTPLAFAETPPLHTLVVPAPTRTATPTSTPSPTSQPLLPSPTPTLTPALAESTATLTATLGITTPLAETAGTQLSTLTPTISPTATTKPTKTKIKTPRNRSQKNTCTPKPPQGWRRITVQRGQTLSLLAQTHRTTVSRLKNVNCLSSDLILVGQHLWAPALPTPTPRPPRKRTKTPTPTSLPTHTPISPTETPISPGETPVPPTETPTSPTDTPIPPTNTPVPPTNTPLPPTNTPIPPTNTPVPPTNTPLPPTNTPVPPTDTPIPTATP
ncbi:MAG: LysM peptidoglycan-binding domain-containing protein [Chloroflexi bacterium]|nr:LysM peptidoglycan-binding domain-containing protein [Chloroflexota bacterium]